jgi:hypothetical protein
MTANTQDSRPDPSIVARGVEELGSAPADEAEEQHHGLYCVAIGTDPAGREHRIKIREAGTSFIMIDSRRRCRVNAHWARRLTEEDIAKEVAFVFRVKVDAFEYPEVTGLGEAAAARTRESKAKYWKAWGRKTNCRG